MYFKENIFDDIDQIKSVNDVYKSLSEVEKVTYLKLYILYRQWFSEYIIKKLNLCFFDDLFLKLDVGFPMVSESEMDFYQYYVSDVLKYIYIRNDLFIERLTPDELFFLKYKLQKNETNYNEQIQNFVENTYKKVIFYDICKNNSKCKVFYGPCSSNYLVSNDAIVLGIRYNELYFLENNNAHIDLDYHLKMMENFNNCILALEKRINEILPNEVRVIKYNKSSITERLKK